MRCLETRHTPEGYIRRRRVDDAGVRFWTIEIPETVWRGINRQGRDNDRAAAFGRVLERLALRHRAIAQMHDGMKAIASAHELGVPLRTIQRWRKDAAQQHVRAARGEQPQA